MEVTGLSWVGTRTESFDEMARFFGEVMGIERDEEQPGFVSFKTPRGEKVEVFATDESEHGFMTTGPAVGFAVTDLDGARSELEAAGIEFMEPTQRHGDFQWAHFRGPDGNIYEITSS
jgi:catechol 2,3-dioxygenase-like lactoylglutathione lyase family enzyme